MVLNDADLASYVAGKYVQTKTILKSLECTFSQGAAEANVIQGEQNDASLEFWFQRGCSDASSSKFLLLQGDRGVTRM